MLSLKSKDEKLSIISENEKARILSEREQIITKLNSWSSSEVGNVSIPDIARYFNHDELSLMITELMSSGFVVLIDVIDRYVSIIVEMPGKRLCGVYADIQKSSAQAYTDKLSVPVQQFERY
jgi:hypothetical protein